MRAQLRRKDHALVEVCTTTIAQSGSHISTGRCKCGWRTEQTYAYEVRDKYRDHLRFLQPNQPPKEKTK